jgi:DNA-binding CsgD family transcriptional regulator
LDEDTKQKGIDMLMRSLEISVKNAYHEHAARVYIILGADGITIKDYALAKKALAEGIAYCEERDLDAQKIYLLSSKARLHLETGDWNEACRIAEELLKDEILLPVNKIVALIVLATIKIRRGDRDVLPLMIEAKALAFEAMELQRIVPAFLVQMEYEWITGKSCIEADALSQTIAMIVELGKFKKKSRLYFWLKKTGREDLLSKAGYESLQDRYKGDIISDVALWEEWSSPYEQALALFEGNDADKKRALTMVQALGAGAVYEKMKLEMRSSGIKSIPRGIRKTTRSNAAHLTGRELDVLKSLKEGLQNKEIADKLFISPKTVDHHISSILLKLGVNSRTKAVREAIHMEIIG